MPKLAKELTVKELTKRIKNLSSRDGIPVKDGAIAVGGVKGLYAGVRNNELAFWMLKDRKDGKKTIYYSKDLTLAQVKELARTDRAKKIQGIDPKEEKRAMLDAKKKQEELDRLCKIEDTATLEKITKDWFTYQKTKLHRWENAPKNALREFQRLSKHVLPIYGKRPVKTITAQNMADLFNKLFFSSHETAVKLLSHLRSIFSYARTSKKFGHVPNPFDDDFMELTKGARKKDSSKEKHFPALPFDEVPALMKALLQKGDCVSLAIAFSILTATRGQVVRLATWDEVDLVNKVWVIPEEHDKVKGRPRELRTILLTDAVVDFLNRLPFKEKGGLLFPPFPPRPFTAMNDATMSKHLKDMHKQKKLVDGIGWIDPSPDMVDEKTNRPKVITQHGTARSSFQTWARDDVSGNYKKYDATAVDFCLLHSRKDMYNGAYDRHLLKKHRREIMKDWADHCLHGIKLDDYLSKS